MYLAIKYSTSTISGRQNKMHKRKDKNEPYICKFRMKKQNLSFNRWNYSCTILTSSSVSDWKEFPERKLKLDICVVNISIDHFRSQEKDNFNDITSKKFITERFRIQNDKMFRKTVVFSQFLCFHILLIFNLKFPVKALKNYCYVIENGTCGSVCVL